MNVELAVKIAIVITGCVLCGKEFELKEKNKNNRSFRTSKEESF